MRTNERILERIEDAERDLPFCEQCGRPTTVAERERTLFLECPTVDEPRSLLSSILRLDFASLHTNRLIAELPAA